MSDGDILSSLPLHTQAAVLTFLELTNGTADAYPTIAGEVAVRLRCLVLRGGAVHIPIDDKFDKLDIIAKLDTGILVQAMTVSIVRLLWRIRKGGAAHRPIEERLESEGTIPKLDAGIA